MPTAFPLQHDTDNKIHLYLQLDRIIPRMGLAATGWEDRTFLGKGELYHNSQIIVEFINPYWNCTNA